MKSQKLRLMKRINSINRKTKEADMVALTTGRYRYKGLKQKLHRALKSFACNQLGLCIMAGGALLTTSCDEHRDYPDTSIKMGQVLCTDGNVLTVDEVERQGKEPIAVVFYARSSDSTEGNGYAVYLHDIAPAELADSIGFAQGTSADISAYDGNSNTFAIYATTSCGSPAAQAVFDMWRYGQSAYIPSVAEMKLLYLAKSIVNPIIEKLGGDALPDSADNVWYWTSTEVSGQTTAKAWLYSLGSGAMQETPKTQAHKVRPIITLNN
jgi:hypothetical protein